jgi:hypothetical protein
MSLLPLEEVKIIPNTTAFPFPKRPPNDPEAVVIVPGTPRIQGNALVRVGVSCTDQRPIRWSIAQNKWTLALNVIMVGTPESTGRGPSRVMALYPGLRQPSRTWRRDGWAVQPGGLLGRQRWPL